MTLGTPGCSPSVCVSYANHAAQVFPVHHHACSAHHNVHKYASEVVHGRAMSKAGNSLLKKLQGCGS